MTLFLMRRDMMLSAFSIKRLVSSNFINVGNNNQKLVFTYLHYIVFFLKNTSTIFKLKFS